MQDKKYLATIVPLGPQARKQIQKGENLDVIRAAVWSETAKKLTPLLGSVCSRFLPATYAWSICNYRPFGVMLGGVTADMEDMLLCYPPLRSPPYPVRAKRFRSCSSYYVPFLFRQLFWCSRSDSALSFSAWPHPLYRNAASLPDARQNSSSDGP